VRRQCRRLQPDQRGSGTVLAIALVAVTLVVIAGVALLGRAQAVRGAAQSAADLGALAAAQDLTLPSGAGGRAGTAMGFGAPDGACEVARAVVVANGSALTGCVLLGGGVVRVTTARPGGPGTGRASARAGPRDTPAAAAGFGYGH
jgi:secretion/DNA translocation related TadE-like protein